MSEATDAVRDANKAVAGAETIANAGHDGYAASDRGDYAAMAQVYATLALVHETRAARLQLGDALDRIATTLEALEAGKGET